MNPADDATLRRVTEEVNRAIREVMNGGAVQARYRYFGARGADGAKPGHMYFWTVETIDGSGKYASGIYAFNPKMGRLGGWTPTRVVKHKTRKAAKARALKLYLKAEGDA